MARINQNYDKLAADYLFPEIARRTNAFLENNPSAKCSIWNRRDTTEPIVSSVINGLRAGVDALGVESSYSGYGPSEGINTLRESLASLYAERGVNLEPEEFLLAMGQSLIPLIFKAFFLPIVSLRFKILLIPFMLIVM